MPASAARASAARSWRCASTITGAGVADELGRQVEAVDAVRADLAVDHDHVVDVRRDRVVRLVRRHRHGRSARP